LEVKNITSEHAMHYFDFTVVKGVQAKRNYYLTSCAFGYIPKIFNDLNYSNIPPELRSQRILNKSRVPAIKKYILSNDRDYVFSAIAVSVDGDVKYEKLEGDIGKLSIHMNSKFIINDGQHRVAAIIEALKEDPLLEWETIPMVIFIDQGLEKSQQVFTDLNRHTVKPAPSISILYDTRDPLADLVRYLSENVIHFKDLVEFEKTSISNRAFKLFTLNGIYSATKTLLGITQKNIELSDHERELAKEFWQFIGDNIKEWELVKKGSLTPYDLRKSYIHAHGVFLSVIAQIGFELLSEGLDYRKYLSDISKIDWDRNNSLWEGRTIQNGRISKSTTSIQLTVNALKNELGIDLNDKELELEGSYR